MNDSQQLQAEKIDTSTSVHPDKTSLVIAPGIVIKGCIVSEIEDADSRLLILGRVEGDIFTRGIVQVCKGGVVSGSSVIEADTLVVSGSVIGENVTVKTRLLVIQSTGDVTVNTVRVPPGGLELQRGGRLDARMTMSDPAPDLVQQTFGGQTNNSQVFAQAFNRSEPLNQSSLYPSAPPHVVFDMDQMDRGN